MIYRNMKTLTLLLTISIAFASNSSLAGLYLNDAPVWEDFPSESIDEDCENGCTSGEFLLLLKVTSVIVAPLGITEPRY